MTIHTWITIVIFVFLIGYLAYLIVTKQWVKLREIAYALMLQAERVFQDSQGKEKFEWVFNTVYNYIPAWLQHILTKEVIRTQLQLWYDAAKAWLKDGLIDI